jgi:hypothetical protein
MESSGRVAATGLGSLPLRADTRRSPSPIACNSDGNLVTMHSFRATIAENVYNVRWRCNSGEVRRILKYKLLETEENEVPSENIIGIFDVGR